MKKKKNLKKEITIIVIPLIILSGIVLAIVYSNYNASQKLTYEQFLKLNLYSEEEVKFLKEQGFLDLAEGVKPPETKEQALGFLKSPGLIEQKLNSSEETFEVLATKLDVKNNSYQMAFKLENKSEQEKEFYLIPVSDNNQTQFREIKGSIKNPGFDKLVQAIFQQADLSQQPLAELYDVEQHKKELKPELAQAYDDIGNNNYQAKPIKITLGPQSSYLAQSKWSLNKSSASADFPREPVYFLVYGSAGGAKDDLIVYGDEPTGKVKLYYVYIDKIGEVEKGQEAGQNEKGDVIGIYPYIPQYDPTSAELERYKVVVMELTEEEQQQLLEPEQRLLRIDQKTGKEIYETIKARKRKIDIDKLENIKQKEYVDKQTILQNIIIKP